MNQIFTTGIRDTSFDPDEAPKLTQADLDRAHYRINHRNVSREEWAAAARKHLSENFDVSLLTSEQVVAFRATGAGWEDRVRRALDDWLRTHSPMDV
jgi:uncharacterized protein (DUF4415 family)